MRSCRERISDAVLTALQTVPPQYVKRFQSETVLVERNRRDPIAENELPSLILIEGNETPRYDFTGEDAYDFQLAVQGAVIGKGPDAATRANALRAYVQQALLKDRTLCGLVRDLTLTDTGDIFGCDTAAADTEGFILGFNTVYATVEGDPFTFAYEEA